MVDKIRMSIVRIMNELAYISAVLRGDSADEFRLGLKPIQNRPKLTVLNGGKAQKPDDFTLPVGE